MVNEEEGCNTRKNDSSMERPYNGCYHLMRKMIMGDSRSAKTFLLLSLLCFVCTFSMVNISYYVNDIYQNRRSSISSAPTIKNNLHNTTLAPTKMITSISSNNMSYDNLADEPLSPLPMTHYYTCGYDQTNFLYNIYPELRGLTKIPFERGLEKNITSKDFFIYGLGGFCQGFKERFPTDHFKRHIQGTTIIVNGEGHHFRTWQRGFHLGYGPADNVTSMKLFYGVLHTLTQSLEVQKRIYDPIFKAKSSKERFLIYAATNCVKYRDGAFHNVSQIDTAYRMGPCHGIANKTISLKEDKSRDGFTNNYYQFGKYKFCLVLENRCEEGYITEKIFNAYMGGCIPIYYGTLEVFNVFNVKSFIYYDIKDPQPALDRIKFLNENATAYAEVMAEPILANGNTTVEEYFSLNDGLGGGKLKNRIRQMIDNGRRRYVT